MSVAFLRSTILLIFSIAYYGIQNAQGQRIVIDQNTCDIEILARSYFNPKEYVTLCAECKDKYTLSFNLQQCILTSELPQDKLQYCKRLNRDGETCIEAKCTIQINESGDYVSVQYGNKNENCAKFNSITGICLFPRFGFELNLDEESIIENTNTYCALSQSQGGQKVCIEYHSVFIDTNQGYSVFPDLFLNDDKILIAKSTSSNIACIEGYELIQQLDPADQSNPVVNQRSIFGCGLILFKIPHCLEYNIRLRICIKCEKGYSLSKNGRECIQFDHCVSHIVLFNVYICLKCEAMYFLYKNHCIFLNYCAIQDLNGSCAYCTSPRFGQMCEIINKTIPDECELLNRFGSCVKCKDNDKYFYHIFHKRCELRVLSVYCKLKSYLSDQCDSFECEQGYRFNINHYEIYYGKFYTQQLYSCSYLKEQVMDIKYWNWLDLNYYNSEMLIQQIRDVYYYKYYFNIGNYEEQPFCVLRERVFDGCIIYDECFESCSKCISGLTLSQISDGTSNYYYRFTCKNIQVTIKIKQILHCIKYNNQNGLCLACENYYTNYQDSCKIGEILNCLVYGDQGQCIQCENNYTLSNNQCFYVEFCLEYQWIQMNIYCTKCIERPDTAISLIQTSNLFRSDCVVNLPNDFCAYYIDSVCMRCQRGFVLVVSGTNRCIRKEQVKRTNNCLKCDQNLICIECIPGYRLVTVNGIPQCIQVNGSCVLRKTCDTTICTIDCFGLYINQQPTCQYQCPEHQGIYYDQCVDCSYFFGEGCVRCSNQIICDLCDSGYHWDNDSRRCKYQCSNGQITNSIYQCNNCRVIACAKCSEPDICIQCSQNLFLQNNTCVDQCSEGYNQLIGTPPQVNRCYQCPTGCIACGVDVSGIIYCTKCASELFLDQGKCIDRCAFYALGQDCTSICPNYILDGQCVDSCPALFIQRINEDGQHAKICVSKCDSYIYEDNKQECAYQNCRDGYYANQENKICQKCLVEHCTSCLNGIKQCGLCECGYSLKDNRCLYVCQDSLRLVDDPFQCLRCSQRGCTNDCFYEGGCSGCQENYVLENKQCRCPTEKGLSLVYPGSCVKNIPCQDPNCNFCYPYTLCTECLPPYFLMYIGFNELGLEVQNCVYPCPDGYYPLNGTCLPCRKHCKVCTTSYDCIECESGYYPFHKIFQPKKSIFNFVDIAKVIICYFKCWDGKYVLDPSQCKSPWWCDDYESGGYCQKCKVGFVKNADGTCVNLNCQLRKCKECVAGTNSQCSVCEDQYQPENGKCKFVCPGGDLSQTDDDFCPVKVIVNQCPISNCDICSLTLPIVCTRCQPGYILWGNMCLLKCGPLDNPLNFFTCIECPYLCETCDISGNCLTCKGTNSIVNRCICPPGYVYYHHGCRRKCPVHSKNIRNEYCLNYCIDGLFPYYTANKEQILCETMDSPQTSNFCIQNIEYIPDLLTISMDPIEKDDTSFKLKITLEQTPSSCYTYLLVGSFGFTQVPQIFSEDYDSLVLINVLPLLPQLSEKLQCSDIYCKASLEIYFAEAIQYIINITINLELNLILTNGITYQGTYTSLNAICPTCIIPSTLTVDSRVEVTCDNNSSCNEQEIQTFTNSKITIVQYISDPRFYNNKIQPHSLRLVYTNSKGVDITLFINNYYYDNSQLGKISYTFTAIALRGLLIVTSVVNSAVYTNLKRVLENNQSTAPPNGTFYPQYKISLQVLDDKIAQQSNSANEITVQKNVSNYSATIIGASIGGGVLFIIIGVVIYKVYKKRQEKKSKYQRARSMSIVEIPLPQKEGSVENNQVQNQIKDEKKEIRIPSIAEHL